MRTIRGPEEALALPNHTLLRDASNGIFYQLIRSTDPDETALKVKPRLLAFGSEFVHQIGDDTELQVIHTPDRKAS